MARYEAFKFFREHAGHSVPPGRAMCALELARAEEWGESLDDRLTIEWQYDDVPYDPGDAYTSDEAARLFESGEWTGPYGCVVRLDGEIRASLWGIVVGPQETDDPYCRVVAAELVDELLYEVTKEAAEAARAANMDVATVTA